MEELKPALRSDPVQSSAEGLARQALLTRASMPVCYSLASRLNVTQNRPSGFDYMRLALSLGVICSHSAFLTGDQDSFLASTPIFASFILPMFFSLSGFLVAGSLERSKTLIAFIGLRAFRIMPALTVEVLLSAFLLGPFLTTLSIANYVTDAQLASYFLNILGDIHYQLPGV